MKPKIGNNVQGTVWENGEIPRKFKGTIVDINGGYLSVYIRTSKYSGRVMEFYDSELIFTDAEPVPPVKKKKSK